MSSKPGSKAAKHPTPGHKRKAGTSERGSASPTGSLISDGGEREGAGSNATVHPLDEILTGDDIQALRITDEKLRKLHPLQCTSPSTMSAPPLPNSPKQVMVRRTRAPDHTHKRSKRVAVLRPLLDDVSVSATRTLELGAHRRGKKMSSDGELPPVHTAPSPCNISNSSPHTFSYIDTIVPRETHALQYWDEAMEDRKHQQDYLTKRLQKSPEMLAMNRGDGYREVQEERMRIDRAIPPLDYGKGYRVGSEFWSQTVPIGDVETGINTTLSCSERGQPLPLETIGVPRTLRREKGMASTERNAPLHYTWQTTPYLTSRTQQLHSTLTDIQDAKPDVDELEVIGRAPHHSPHSVGDHSLDSLGEEESYSEDDEDNSHSRGASLDMLPETYSHPLMGPALTIEGHLLKWEGPPRPGSKSSLEPVDVRVTFESGVEEEVTSYLTMENSGTSSIYYSWKHLVQPNPLQTVQAGDTQRFYFDVRGGVLLPGQQLSFPFVFKSPNAGIFTEIWALQTGPVIAGGRAIRVTLRGVAFREDTSKHRRDELEQELNHKITVVAAERLINRIVDSIATPPHSPPPLQTTPTEEEMFRTNNPQLFYHYNIVQQLKMLYSEIMHPELLEDHPPPSGVGDTGAGHSATPTTRDKGKTASGGAGRKEKGGSGGKDKKGKTVKEETQKESVHEVTEESPKPMSSVPDWDFSTDSLLQVVLGVEEDEAREKKLKQLSDLLGELSFPPPILPRTSSYTLVYQLVSEAMEQVSATSQHLCQVMGLPQRESCPVKCTSGEDDQLSSTPSSSAVVNKKDKDKKGKKQDTKKLSVGKDKERAPSRSKGVAGKKSRSSVGNKDTEPAEPAAEQQSTPQSVQVNPVLEKKYKNNFHALVYGILADTVNKMTLVLPEQI